MFKKIFKKIVIISIELLLISGALWYLAAKKGYKSPLQIVPAVEQAAKIQKPFPQLQTPIERKFSWEYKGQKYWLTKTFYQSVDEYYKNSSKSFSYFGSLPGDWEEQYYGQFLKTSEQDKTIEQLAGELQDLGNKHKLSDDEIVDLTLAFVQAIPYDDAKAKEILAKDPSATMRFPYEVLYEQLGVCSDKSLLSIALLRQMGYGAAIFAFQEDNHMAIGIQCPQNNSNYGSGYCYGETTATGNKIGIIPDFDASSNKTVTVSELQDVNLTRSPLKALGEVTIFQNTTGKEYRGIIETQKIVSQIDALKKTIDQMLPKLQSEKKDLASQEVNLNNARSTVEKMQQEQQLDIDKYNALVKKYNQQLEEYKKDVKKFNSDVTLYNQTIARYNTLIKQ